MIVENSQSFSAPLIHSQLFTRPVLAVRIPSVVAQIAYRMSLAGVSRLPLYGCG